MIMNVDSSFLLYIIYILGVVSCDMMMMMMKQNGRNLIISKFCDDVDDVNVVVRW